MAKDGLACDSWAVARLNLVARDGCEKIVRFLECNSAGDCVFAPGKTQGLPYLQVHRRHNFKEGKAKRQQVGLDKTSGLQRCRFVCWS
jgi:hypothetical protein